jgi:hypothetical protein
MIAILAQLLVLAVLFLYGFSFSVFLLACLVPARRARVTWTITRHLLFLALVMVLLAYETWGAR